MGKEASDNGRVGQKAGLSGLEETIADWESNELAQVLKRQPETKKSYETAAGTPLKRVYSRLDVDNIPESDIGLPGRYPFTRGPYPTMYRGRNWTMRQIAGFGTGSDTNERYKFLLKTGQTGLSTDFDMPTLMGYDSDHPMAHGEVGREGVAIDTLDDMEALFEDIDLTSISVSLTINPTAWILFSMYIAVAQARGYDLNKLSGTIQADILKEYVAQKEWIYPIRPSVRLVRDCIMYGAQEMKRYNPINISGYHISEAGATAVQEAAFTMANTITYVEEITRAGLDVDSFAPRLSFFFVSQADFFEEVAKFRALRRVYAKLMKNKFGAKNPESMRLRFHTQTAAATLTKPQHTVNVVRTTLQALAAVLGGTQSLHTNGMDEAFTIPSEEAMQLALRTQQVIADETNITSVVDPLGGSYMVEHLTTKMEEDIFAILAKIDEMGGTIKAIEAGWFQKEIADSAYEFALGKAKGERPVIGVNKYVQEEEGEPDIPLHPYDPGTEERQIASLVAVREGRDNVLVEKLLNDLATQAGDPSVNLITLTIDLVKARASMGEIVEKLKGVWGTYREQPVI